MYLNFIRFIAFFAMPDVESHKHKLPFIFNAHHTSEVAVERTDVWLEKCKSQNGCVGVT